MRIRRMLPAALLVLVTLGVAVWLASQPQQRLSSVGAESQERVHDALRIGLLPEGDPLLQRQRFRQLADYLSEQLERPVDLATSATAETLLEDFDRGRVHAAILPPLTAYLSYTRSGTRIVAKAVMHDGRSTVQAVIFVSASSPVRKVEELAGGSMSLLPLTMEGVIFAPSVLKERIPAGRLPEFRWAESHQAVIRSVLEGRADAGASTVTRLEAFEASNHGAAFRRLVLSEEVPALALVTRINESELSSPLHRALLEAHRNPTGQATLLNLGADRFVPCEKREYLALEQMMDTLGSKPELLGSGIPLPALEPNR